MLGDKNGKNNKKERFEKKCWKKEKRIRSFGERIDSGRQEIRMRETTYEEAINNPGVRQKFLRGVDLGEKERYVSSICYRQGEIFIKLCEKLVGLSNLLMYRVDNFFYITFSD